MNSHLPKLIFQATMILIATAGGWAQELEIELKLQSGEESGFANIEFEETFEVVIRNVSDRILALPDEFSNEGISALSFNVRERISGNTYHLYRQTETESSSRRTNNSVELKPGETFSLFPGFAFDRWGKQQWRNLPTPNFDIEFEIVAQFETKESKNDHWVGKISSSPTTFRFVFERAKLPQQYLLNGFPDAALKMLVEDSNLVHQKDEYQQTPLHLAARFNQPEVAQWLIEHGAKVDAQAYNHVTPLYSGLEHSQMCRLLLSAGADPHLETANGESPLQRVARQLAEEWIQDHPERRQKWNASLDAFLEHGVKLDLLSAIQLGRTQEAIGLLTANPEILQQFKANQKPLRMATKHGRVEIAKHLLANFPDQMDVDNFAGGSGYPVIKEGLKHVDVVSLLIDAGADLQRRITWQGMSTGFRLVGDNATLLHFAARDGTPETIKLLLDKGINAFAHARTDSSDEYQQTALDVACIFGNSENAIEILNSDAFLKGKQEDRQEIMARCLATVCAGSLNHDRSDDIKIVKSLLENSVNPNDRLGSQSLIQLATQSIHANDKNISEQIRPLIDLLVQAGISMDLYSAVAIRDVKEVARLLKSDPTLSESRRPDGYPAVHFAISCGELELVKQLIEAGCNLNLKNHSKSSGNFAGRMMHVAAFWNQPEIAKFLIESGAEVNVIAKQKVTPLHEAARTGSMEMVKLLLENGADIHAVDINGRTPLTNATNPRIKKLLRDWLAKK